MKKSLNLAKIASLVLMSVAVVSVTFFVTGFVVKAATTWTGPTSAPPGGNPPGFIFNAASGGTTQNADINISGTGTFGDIKVVDGAASTGSIVVDNQICFRGTTDCVNTFQGLGGGGNIWSRTGTTVNLVAPSDLVHIGTPVSSDPNNLANKLKLYVAGDFGNTDRAVILHLQGSSISDTGQNRLVLAPPIGGYISLEDGSSNSLLYTDGTSKNVGIGTKNPAFKLHVVGTQPGPGNNSLMRTQIENTDSTGGADLQFKSGSSAGAAIGFSGSGRNYPDASFNNWAWFQNSTPDGGIGFYTGTGDGYTNNRMNILANGRVGIGTYQPQTKLDVNGPLFLVSNPTTGGGNTEFESYYSSDPWPADPTNPNNTSYGGYMGVGFRANEYYNSATKAMAKTRRGPSGTIEMKEWGDWMFTVSPDGAQGASAQTNRKNPLTLKNDGRVGISTSDNNWNDGTQMDDAALTVYKNGGGGAIDAYGTYGPWAWSGIRLWNGGTTWDSADGSNNGNGNKYWGIWHQTGNIDPTVSGPDDFRINEYTGTSNNHVEALTLQSITGRMGLLITKPTAQLDIGGEGNIKLAQRTAAPNPSTANLYNLNGDLYWGTNKLTGAGSGSGQGWTVSGTNTYTNPLGNKVGIGTATPNANLSFGTGVNDNKVFLYDGSSDKYGFGIRGGQLIVYSGAGGDTVFGNYNGTTFTERARVAATGDITNTGAITATGYITGARLEGGNTFYPVAGVTSYTTGQTFFGNNYGVYANAADGGSSSNAYGIYANASGATGNNYGVYGSASGANAYGGYFTGGVRSDRYCIGTSCITAWNQAGGSDVWTTSGNNIYNSNSGYVGIGTSNPTMKLTVNGDFGSTIASKLRINNSYISDTGPELALISGTGNTNITDASQNSILYAQGSNRNVGIGTKSPTEKLYVAGNIKATGTVCDGSNNCLGAATNNSGWTDAGALVNLTTASDSVAVGATSANGLKLYVNGDFGRNNGAATMWLYGSQISDTGASTLNIIPGGNPGNVNIQNGSGSSVIYTQGSTQKVGIGSTNPQGKLYVVSTTATSGTVNYGLRAEVTGSNQSNIAIFGDATAGTSPNTSFGGFFTGGLYADRMCLGSASNCITSWPTGGGSSAWTDNGTNVYVTNTAENVGIGTTSPGAKLEVNGDLLLSSGADRIISNKGRSSGSLKSYNLTIHASDQTRTGDGGDLYLAGGSGDVNDGHVVIASGENGSVGIGTVPSNNSGFKFLVTGNAYFQGSTLTTGSVTGSVVYGSTSVIGNALTINNDASVGGTMTANNLTIPAGGNLNAGIYYNKCNNVSVCVCPAGYYLLTGGVECNTQVQVSYPRVELNQWYGQCDALNKTPQSIRIYCMKGTVTAITTP